MQVVFDRPQNTVVKEQFVMISLKERVECPYCSHNQVVDCRDYVIDESYDDREMGSECEYTIECEAFECENCHREFALEGSIWEYPEGMRNDSTVAPVATQEDGDEDAE